MTARPTAAHRPPRRPSGWRSEHTIRSRFPPASTASIAIVASESGSVDEVDVDVVAVVDVVLGQCSHGAAGPSSQPIVRTRACEVAGVLWPGQVDCLARERDRPRVGREHGREARPVARPAIGGHAHEDGRTAHPVAQVHLLEAAAEDQVVGLAREGDEAAVRRESERCRERGMRARPVTLRARRRDARSLRRAGCPVMNEDVVHAVRVARDKRRRFAPERDEAAVGGEGRLKAVRVGLRAVGRDAHPAGRPGRAVADEDVELPVAVARHEVRRRAEKRHDGPVRRDRRRDRRVVGSRPVVGQRDERDALRRAVVEIHPAWRIGDAGRPRRAVECDEAAVGRDRRLRARPPDLRGRGIQRHALRAPEHPIANEHVAAERVRVGENQIAARLERDEAAVGRDAAGQPAAPGSTGHRRDQLDGARQPVGRVEGVAAERGDRRRQEVRRTGLEHDDPPVVGDGADEHLLVGRLARGVPAQQLDRLADDREARDGGSGKEHGGRDRPSQDSHLGPAYQGHRAAGNRVDTAASPLNNVEVAASNYRPQGA